MGEGHAVEGMLLNLPSFVLGEPDSVVFLQSDFAIQVE